MIRRAHLDPPPAFEIFEEECLEIWWEPILQDGVSSLTHKTSLASKISRYLLGFHRLRIPTWNTTLCIVMACAAAVSKVAVWWSAARDIPPLQVGPAIQTRVQQENKHSAALRRHRSGDSLQGQVLSIGSIFVAWRPSPTWSGQVTANTHSQRSWSDSRKFKGPLKVRAWKIIGEEIEE